MNDFALVVKTIFENVYQLLDQTLVPPFDFSFAQLFLGIAALNIVFLLLRVLHLGGEKGSSESDRKAFLARRG